MERSYSFGNVNLTLLSDSAFEDEKHMLPFVSNRSEKSILCIFEITDRIELPDENKTYISPSVTVYDRGENNIKTYTMPLLKSEGAIIYKTDIGYECSYVEQYKDYFSKSINLINAVGIEQIAFDSGMYILHCSFVEYKGKAILFTGASGEGKSTRAEMWKNELGGEIINGDKAGLFVENGVLYACGLPVAGSSDIFINKSLPIDSIVILKKSSENLTRKAGFSEAMKEIYYNMIVNEWNKDFCSGAISFAADILKFAKVFVSECNLDTESVYEQLNALENRQ